MILNLFVFESIPSKTSTARLKIVFDHVAKLRVGIKVKPRDGVTTHCGLTTTIRGYESKLVGVAVVDRGRTGTSPRNGHGHPASLHYV